MNIEREIHKRYQSKHARFIVAGLDELVASKITPLKTQNDPA